MIFVLCTGNRNCVAQLQVLNSYMCDIQAGRVFFFFADIGFLCCPSRLPRGWLGECYIENVRFCCLLILLCTDNTCWIKFHGDSSLCDHYEDSLYYIVHLIKLLNFFGKLPSGIRRVGVDAAISTMSMAICRF
jgi:hypothetical protein